jgi:glycosyltransferase involved in cell wall biosynthesis
MIRACLFGTYNATHPANRLLAEALAAAGLEVTVCHQPLWERTRDKMASFFSLPSLARLALAYVAAAGRLAARLRRLPQPDLVVTGFNGQLDVPLARLIAGRHVRLVFAPLVTLTETLVDDRRVYRPQGARARLAAALDRWTLESADLVLMDSEAHRAYVAQRLTARARTATLYLGASHIFSPAQPRRRSPGDRLRVLFYGQYVPLHGARVIVEAAALVGPDTAIDFTMIGTGPEREMVERVARERVCTHVSFEDWVPFESLPGRLADCDVALGSFGVTPKAGMVIPTKVYQAAAVGRAVVSGDSPALREVFTPDEHVLAVPRGDPRALAAALCRLRDTPDLAPRLGAAAARLLHENLDARAQGARLRTVLAGAFPELAWRLDAAGGLDDSDRPDAGETRAVSGSGAAARTRAAISEPKTAESLHPPGRRDAN